MQIRSTDKLASFINQHSFGILITESLDFSQIPFHFAKDEGVKGVLYGHVAKANKHWRTFDETNALIVFQGPHAYISPTWYASKPAVPTWNYATVHCRGKIELLPPEQNQLILNKLTANYEPALLNDKAIMPDEYQSKLSRAIVTFKIVLNDIQGKEKLGQSKSQADQAAVYAALQQQDNHEAAMLAAYMKQHAIGIGD